MHSQDSEFKKELKKGREIEREHSQTIKKLKQNPNRPKKKVYTDIAKDHLKEDPKYYTKLKKYVESTDEQAKNRKRNYDEISEPKVSWETYKTLERRYGVEKAKQKAKSLVKENKKVTTAFTSFIENYNSIFTEDVEGSIESRIDSMLDAYIEKYKKNVDLLLQNAKKKGLDAGDINFVKGLKVSEIKKTRYKKKSIIKKTAQIFETAKNLSAKLEKRFGHFANDIRGKSADEIETLSFQLANDITIPLKSWNVETMHRDLVGHLTQPSKMVLTDLFRSIGLDIPINFKGIAGNPEAEQAFIDYKINPEFHLSIVLNLAAMKALNTVVSQVDPTIRPIVIREILKGIYTTRSVKERMLKYIQDSNLKDDFSEVLLAKKAPNTIQKTSQTMASGIQNDKKSLQSEFDDI